MTLNSHSLLYYHSGYADVTQITWGVYWYQKSLNAMARYYSCILPAEFPVLRDFSAQKPTSLHFSLQVCLAASVFASRPMATGNISGALRIDSVIVVEGFLQILTDMLTQFLPSSPPGWTKLNQTKPVPCVSNGCNVVQSLFDSWERMRAWLVFRSIKCGSWGIVDG